MPGEPPLAQDKEFEAALDGLDADEPECSFSTASPEQLRTPVIDFRDVGISFGERTILQNVSFDVRHGETVCILGRSGVGKSVALRMLMGFLKPDAGSIRVDGEEITQYGEEEIQRLVELLIGLVGAEDVIEVLPASLSTGRKRAVAIARALAAKPEVVLYDEPTTMVDPIIARRLGDLIQRLKKERGFTSIVVTHDMRFAERLADRVLFLHQGKALFFGPLSDFLNSSEEPIRQFLELDAYQLPQA